MHCPHTPGFWWDTIVTAKFAHAQWLQSFPNGGASADGIECAQRVGPQTDPGADFREHRRSLVQNHLEARLAQCDRGTESRNTGTNDDGFHGRRGR